MAQKNIKNGVTTIRGEEEISLTYRDVSSIPSLDITGPIYIFDHSFLMSNGGFKNYENETVIIPMIIINSLSQTYTKHRSSNNKKNAENSGELLRKIRENNNYIVTRMTSQVAASILTGNEPVKMIYPKFYVVGVAIYLVQHINKNKIILMTSSQDIAEYALDQNYLNLCVKYVRPNRTGKSV